jgi:hypothetical protein
MGKKFAGRSRRSGLSGRPAAMSPPAQRPRVSDNPGTAPPESRLMPVGKSDFAETALTPTIDNKLILCI